MSINLIELFKSTLSDVLVRQSSALLDESAESTSSAIDKIFPAILNAVLIKGSTEAGAKDLLHFLSTNKVDEKLHDDVPALLSNAADTEKLSADGADILKYLLGDKLSYMVDWVASGNGLKTSSASTLLKLVAPLVMGAVARAVKERNLNASGLRDLLQSQSVFVAESSPAAIAELLGISPSAEPEKIASGKLEGNFNTSDEPKGTTMSRLLPWIVLLIAALGLFYFLDKGGSPPPPDLAKMKQDSLENVRKQDSIRNAFRTDSINKAMQMDSVNQPTTLDSI